jgi:hypothetical protein
MYYGGKLFVHKIDERVKGKGKIIDPTNSYIIIKDVRKPAKKFAEDIIEDHKERIRLVKEFSSRPQFWDYGEDETIPPGGTMFQSYKRNPFPQYLRDAAFSKTKNSIGEYVPNYVGAFIPLYIHYTINFDGSGGHTTDERYGRHYGYNALGQKTRKIKWGGSESWKNLNSVEKKIVELDLEKAWIIMDNWKERFFIPGEEQLWSNSKIAQKSWLSNDQGRMPETSIRLDRESVVRATTRQQKSTMRKKLQERQTSVPTTTSKQKKTKKKKTKLKTHPEESGYSKSMSVNQVQEPSFD